MKFNKVHSDFRFNGISYTKEVLKEAAYSFIKEGEPYEKDIGQFLLDWLDDSQTVEVRTSGSTGTPKRIRLQKYHMRNSALATGEFFGLRPGSSALLCLSADYIAGKMMLVRALVLGLHLDSMAPVSNPLHLNRKKYDFGAFVPMQLQNATEQIGNIRTLLVGGAALPAPLKQKSRNSATRIFETYGMTETITHVAVKEIGSGFNTENETESFKALPDVVFSVDKRNCLIIEAPRVSEQPVITNDVVHLISETEFEWLGRYDNVVNSGGVKLFPEQIEQKLENIIEKRFFVVGIPDDQLGQKLILVIEGETDLDILKQKIATLSSFGKFETPREIIALPQFLETETGKVQRQLTIDGLL
ncbi:AMP-binding protein [Aggregatimonas sangjinii]|uniref:AMP-binding protein n=1 Tax=Aggregatimonas sangjinii TaxID=2583587 RepID=UPI001F1EB9EE|nr:AMP-binding protein [Aggregatimonas sangjinii]